MLGVFLLVWSTLLISITLESQVVRTVATSTTPPKKNHNCNYIMKENNNNLGGDHGENLCSERRTQKLNS